MQIEEVYFNAIKKKMNIAKKEATSEIISIINSNIEDIKSGNLKHLPPNSSNKDAQSFVKGLENIKEKMILSLKSQ